MMGRKAAEELLEAFKWVDGLWNPDPYGGEGNSGLAESGIQSSASNAIIENTVTGNGADRFHCKAAAKYLVSMAGSSAASETMDSLRISDDSAAPNVLTNSHDWRSRAYEELHFLKTYYLEDLMKQLPSEQSSIGDKASEVEEMVRFLMIPKADFFQYSQEKVQQMMNLIVQYIILEN